jgi:cyclic pyranopterin phosphate synthase
MLKPCLASEEGRDLRALLRGGASDGELKEAIQEEVSRKPRSHGFSFAGSGMFRIGG